LYLVKLYKEYYDRDLANKKTSLKMGQMLKINSQGNIPPYIDFLHNTDQYEKLTPCVLAALVMQIWVDVYCNTYMYQQRNILGICK
jgi:hypothetical protein